MPSRKEKAKLHRELRPGDLTTRYRRLRDREEPTQIPGDDNDDWGEQYDDYWSDWNWADTTDYEIQRELGSLVSHMGLDSVAARLPDGTKQALEEGASSERGHTSATATADRRPSLDDLLQRMAECVYRWGHGPGREDDWEERRYRSPYLDGTTVSREGAFPELAGVPEKIPGETLGLQGIALMLSPFWLRSPHGWSPPNSQRRDCIISFVNHLFLEYPVPGFVYNNWLRAGWPRVKWACWFLLFARGVSLRKAAEAFNWDIPKRLPKWLREAPEQLSPVEAVMWAEVMSLGGTETVFRWLVAHPAYAVDTTSRLSDPSLTAFWRQTAQWLVSHEVELPTHDVRGILDWAMHLYTEGRRGRRFSWAGRSVARAAEAAEEYRRLREALRGSRLAEIENCRWEAHGWNWDHNDGYSTWHLVELTTGRELIEEGRELGHCVASYVHHCLTDHSAICSLRRDDSRTVTIEVNPWSKRIVQVCGLQNRCAADAEQAMIDRWEKAVLRPLRGGLVGTCHSGTRLH